tara:strand:+ start:4896 stop:5933 length:1038 start_codon:yes stop_codon:yes gene_type:complete
MSALKKILCVSILFLGCQNNITKNKVTLIIGEARIDLVHIPGGHFIMGSDDPMAMQDERPIHKVYIDEFWMTQTPITNKQFSSFVNSTKYVTTAEKDIKLQLWDNKSNPDNNKDENVLPGGSLVFKGGTSLAKDPYAYDWWAWGSGINWKTELLNKDKAKNFDQHPVVHVSWYDAKQFSKWAGMDLPSEAQWEYAAKLGKSKSKNNINIWQGVFPKKNSKEDGFIKTNPVKHFDPNILGLYDMAGNVWEWVNDWYHPRAYIMEGRLKNPTGPITSYDPNEPQVAKKVTRGGSYLCSDQYCSGYRPSARMKTSPESSLENTGFRCVISNKDMLSIMKSSNYAIEEH